MLGMNRVIAIIGGIVKAVGVYSSFLILLLIGIVCIDVVSRYVFNYSAAWVLELEWYVFSIIFLFVGAYAWQQNEHVRVDVFYERFSPRTKMWIDLFGDILFLLPWCALVISMTEFYAYQSWNIRETSPDPQGMPARYVIKYCLPVSFLLIQVYGFGRIWKAICALKETTKDTPQNGLE